MAATLPDMARNVRGQREATVQQLCVDKQAQLTRFEMCSELIKLKQSGCGGDTIPFTKKMVKIIQHQSIPSTYVTSRPMAAIARTATTN